MRLNSMKNDDFDTNIEVQDFRVEMNSMLFYSVINGIYSAKIASPMRELATNARDGHAMAGKLDVPFDVQLPTTFNPVFSVRDYGCSMSHEEIMGLYSTMFASSKRESNEAVGMIGLGSKSPYAYCNQFTVTAWQDGIRRDYVASIGANDIPQIGLINSTPSDEPTGIQVTMAVKTEDVATFKAAANEVFFGFDPKPNIKDFTFPEVESVYKGEGYILYKDRADGWPFQQKAYARQGCVIYPLSPDSLGPRFKGNPIWNMPIIVDFPIGSLSVNTSREALGYDAMTIKSIEDRMKVVLDDMTAIVQKEVDTAPRYIDACSLFFNNRQTNVIYRTLGGTLKYRDGDLLRHTFQLRTTDDATYMVRRYGSGHPWVGKETASVAFAPVVKGIKIDVYPDDMTKAIAIFDIAEEKLEQIPSRVRRAFADAKDKHVYWIKAVTRDKAVEIWKAIGQPDVVELKDTKPLPLKRVSTGGTRAKDLRVFNTLGYSILGSDTVDISEPIDLVFLHNDMTSVFYGAPGNNYQTRRTSMHSALSTLRNQCFPDLDNTPFVFNPTVYERVLKMKNVTPVPYADYLAGLFKGKGIDINDVAKYCNDRDVTLQRMPSNFRSYELSRAILHLKSIHNSHLTKGLLTDDMRKLVEMAIAKDKNENEDVYKDDPFNIYYQVRYTLRNFFPAIFNAAPNTGTVNSDMIDTAKNNESYLWGLLTNQYPLIAHAATNGTTTLKHYLELLAK